MKNKRKKEISNNSKSDADEIILLPAQNVGVDLECNSNKYLKTSKFSEEKLATNNVKESTGHDEEQIIHIEQDSENELSSEKLPDETTNISFVNKNSSKEKLDTVNSIFNAEELTSDDEIYILQCPEKCAKEDLCNQNLDFSKCKQSITCNGEVYKLEILNLEKKFITLAMPRKTVNGCLIKLPLRGHIIVQKDLNIVSTKLKDGNSSDLHKIIFPDDIKVRHPLLGVEWKAYIDIANKAISKNNLMKKKKKKTKSEKSLGCPDVEIKKIKRENSEIKITVPKKKQKK